LLYVLTCRNTQKATYTKVKGINTMSTADAHTNEYNIVNMPLKEEKHKCFIE